MTLTDTYLIAALFIYAFVLIGIARIGNMAGISGGVVMVCVIILISVIVPLVGKRMAVGVKYK